MILIVYIYILKNHFLVSKKWIRLDPFIHTYTRTYQRNPPRKNEIQLFKFEIINRLEIIEFGQISLIYRSEVVARNNTKMTRLTLGTTR